MRTRATPSTPPTAIRKLRCTMGLCIRYARCTSLDGPSTMAASTDREGATMQETQARTVARIYQVRGINATASFSLPRLEWVVTLTTLGRIIETDADGDRAIAHMLDVKRWTVVDAAIYLGISEAAAATQLRRWRIASVGRQPGRGGRNLYRASDVRAAAQRRPGQGARTDLPSARRTATHKGDTTA